MATEWYLMQTPTSLSGYETERFEDYSTESFSEILASYAGCDIKVYDSDMTELKDLRVVVQGNIPDTKDRTLRRTVLSEIGTLKSGWYVKYKDRIYILTGLVDTNGVYEKTTMILCQYQFKWQDDNGKVIERWGNITTASQYNSGIDERNGKAVMLSSNQNIVTLPNDDDSLSFEDRRVFLDRRPNPIKVYKVTRTDEFEYYYGEDDGVIVFLLSRDLYNEETDRQDLRLCDYDSRTADTEDIVIHYNGLLTVRNGGSYKSFKTDSEVTWSIEGTDEQIAALTLAVIDDKSCKIKCAKNNELIDSEFKLIATTNDDNKSEITIRISGGV